MKDFAKSIVCNTKAGNALFPPSKYDDEIHKLEMEYMNIGRSGGNPSEVLGKQADIEKKIQHLKELRRKEIGNSKVGNELTSYEKAKKSDLEKRLKKEEQLLEDAKKMLRSKLSDDDRIGFQMQKEECEKNVSRLKEEIRKIGNNKVGNAAKTFSGKYLDIYDNGTVVIKEGWAFGEKASVNTFERWLDYNIQAKEKVLKETKAMKEEFKRNFI